MNGDQETIRKASTVVLARDTSEGPEVFMLERNIKSEFVSGAYVFPGGAVDKHDTHQTLEQICTGYSDEHASSLVNLEQGGLGFWVAAIRECFEECGVLIAESGTDLISFENLRNEKRFTQYRDDLNNRKITFSEICRAEGLTLPVDRLTYFSRWLTPVGMPKRFDTCFFICPMPLNQVPLHDGQETVNGIWVTPEDALEKGKAGSIKLVPATIKTLETLSGFPSVSALIEGCTPTGKVPTICAEILRDNSGKPVRVRIPFPDGPVELEMGEELTAMAGGPK
ncbi:MAG: NUDIX hydrolase [Gammaproteobacteria bacterium]